MTCRPTTYQTVLAVQTLFAAEVGRRAKEVPLNVYTAADAPRGLLDGLGGEPAFAGWGGSWTKKEEEEGRDDNNNDA